MFRGPVSCAEPLPSPAEHWLGEAGGGRRWWGRRCILAAMSRIWYFNPDFLVAIVVKKRWRVRTSRAAACTDRVAGDRAGPVAFGEGQRSEAE
jgi:hypothetical protein